MASEVLSIMKKMAVPALSNKAKGLAGSSEPSKSLPTVSGSSQGREVWTIPQNYTELSW